MLTKPLIERLQSIPLPELFARYNIEWEEGRNFKRPWGNTATGRTPSCRYYPNTNSVGDFGTHKGGGPINFVALMEDISFTQAAKLLMSWYNIEEIKGYSYKRYLDKLNDSKNTYNKEIKLQTISTLLSTHSLTKENLLRIFLLYCNMNLTPQTEFLRLATNFDKKPLDEFMFDIDDDVRAIIKENLAITKTLRPAQYSEFRDFDAASLYSGMLDSTEVERWEDEIGRYVFPIMLPGNIVIGFGGRSLTPHITKYLTRFEFGFEKKDILYGLDAAIPAIIEKGYVILVEGVLDVARCRKVGHLNVVAPMSTYLSYEQAVILKSFTKCFLLAFDNDQGGNSAAELSAKNLDKCRLLYERVLVPEDEDPDSFGKKQPDELYKLLTSKWL